MQILLNANVIRQINRDTLLRVGEALLAVLTDQRQVVTVETFNAAFKLYPTVEAELFARAWTYRQA